MSRLPGEVALRGSKARRPPPLVGPTTPLAIAGFISVFITALGGIVFGHVVLSQIKRTGEGGPGLALAAVTIGWTLTGIGVLALGIPLLIGVVSGTTP